ncbi:MAG: DUF4260 domain-containing protein [Rhodocyclaceae bacterium]|jgi:hypothetical protein|nr:DUF4260 domain-containing protein [Rhodocyclaceae bacterium]
MTDTTQSKVKVSFRGGAEASVRWLLRVEAAVVSLAAIGLYYHGEGSLGLFLALILVPDLAILGYLRDARLGAFLYNLTHNYALPLLICCVALTVKSDLAFQISLIWIAHIGIDRMLGFGLKYATGFADTHLGQLNRRRPATRPLEFHATNLGKENS